MVITSVGSIAVDDIRGHLRCVEADVTLDIGRVTITRPAEVVRALPHAVGARVILITRGGGEGVQLVDADDLIEAVVNLPLLVALALGHATDAVELAMLDAAGCGRGLDTVSAVSGRGATPEALRSFSLLLKLSRSEK